MKDLFGYLILGSFIALLVGLFKPSALTRLIKEPSRKKIGLIFGSLLIVSFIGFGMTADIKTETVTSEKQTTQAQKSQNEPTSTPPPPTLSKEDEIKNIVTEQLRGKNNLKKDNLKTVRVNNQEGGGWGVIVEFNAGDNLTTNLRKKGIEKQMSEIYTSLYQSGKDIRSVTIAAYFPLVDTYGNEKDNVVYQSVLTKAEADKVNWEADQSTLQLSILPQVWTTQKLHEEFRQ